MPVFFCAMIRRADIEQLIVTGQLRSPDYVAGQRGILINFVTGQFELNGNIPGQGRKRITNQLEEIWDANGVLRQRSGIWGS